MNISNLRAVNEQELVNELENSRRELLNLRCRIALGEDIKSSEVKEVRRGIAKILTVQRERELAVAKTTGGE